MDKVNENFQEIKRLKLKSIPSDEIKDLVFKLKIISPETNQNFLFELTECIFHIGDILALNKSENLDYSDCTMPLRKYYGFVKDVLIEGNYPEKIHSPYLVKLLEDNDFAIDLLELDYLLEFPVTFLKLAKILNDEPSDTSTNTLKYLTKFYELNSQLFQMSTDKVLSEY